MGRKKHRSLRKENQMINSKNIGHARIYFDTKELEEYAEDMLGKRYQGKPIILTDVVFDKHDGSIDMHFLVVMGDDEINTMDIHHKWDCDRRKVTMTGFSTFSLARSLEKCGIEVRDAYGEYHLTSSILRELADKWDELGIAI
jgi:hypothetical protein